MSFIFNWIYSGFSSVLQFLGELVFLFGFCSSLLLCSALLSSNPAAA